MTIKAIGYKKHSVLDKFCSSTKLVFDQTERTNISSECDVEIVTKRSTVQCIAQQK